MDLMAATLTNTVANQPKAERAPKATSDVRQSTLNSKDISSFQSKLDEKHRGLAERGSSSKLSPTPQRNSVPKQVGQDQSSKQMAHDENNPNVRKSREQAPKNSKAEAVDSLTRRAALQSFMKKMKQNLNVNPGQIVSALMALTPEQLQLPPKLNIDQIVGQLELDPAASDKAKIYFDQMLAESSANSMAEYLKGSKRQLSLKVMSQAEKRQSTLENSLQQMNSSFFSAPNKAQNEASSQSADEKLTGLLAAMGVSGAAAMGPVQQATSTAGGASQVAGRGAQSAMNPFFANSNGLTQQSLAQTAVLVEASAAEGIALQGLDSAEKQSVQQSQAGRDFLQSMSSVEGGKMTAASSAGLAAYGVGSATGSSPGVDSSAMEFSKNDFADMSISDGGQAESGGESSLSGFSNSDSGEQDASREGFDGSENIQFSVRTTENGKVGAAAKAGTTSSAFAVTAEHTEAENAKNVREIMQQTQFLMKKGGGEAKVTLNPEGLGQIQLKVATEGEQVHVDMVAESAEAKKLLEKGLGDLKATLASHKLNVRKSQSGFGSRHSKGI
jgi:flagellar hook-length control protein FliK